MNSQNRIIDIIEAEKGTVNQAKPIIREDKEFTDALCEAGEILLVKCLDHIIL